MSAVAKTDDRKGAAYQAGLLGGITMVAAVLLVMGNIATRDAIEQRRTEDLLASLTFENLFDAAYRYHGSAVNGPGRGVMFLMDIGPMWKR